MKKYYNLFLAVLVTTSVFAQQKGKIPTAILKSFEAKFQNTTNVKWAKENAHEYEANFKWNGLNCSANFTDKGEWLETEMPIKQDDLPEAVKNTFKSQKIEKIIAVAKIETSKSTVKYEVEYKHGRKTKELFFDKDGLPLKQ